MKYFFPPHHFSFKALKNALQSKNQCAKFIFKNLRLKWLASEKWSFLSGKELRCRQLSLILLSIYFPDDVTLNFSWRKYCHGGVSPVEPEYGAPFLQPVIPYPFHLLAPAFRSGQVLRPRQEMPFNLLFPNLSSFSAQGLRFPQTPSHCRASGQQGVACLSWCSVMSPHLLVEVGLRGGLALGAQGANVKWASAPRGVRFRSCGIPTACEVVELRRIHKFWGTNVSVLALLFSPRHWRNFMCRFFPLLWMTLFKM